MSTKSKQKSPTKTRGTFLTILLVIMALHGIVAAFAFHSMSTPDAMISRPWLITLMVIHSILNVIAAVGIWKWKMWAWKLYMVSTVIGLAVGLLTMLAVGLLTMGMLSAFYAVLPLAIVGWALRTKWDNFT